MNALDFDFDFDNSKGNADFDQIESITLNSLQAKEKIKLIQTIQLNHEAKKLYMVSRYKQIPFPYYDSIDIRALKGKFSFLLFEELNRSLKGVVVYHETNFKIKILSEYYYAKIEMSDNLNNNPNFFISKYDYFVRFVFSFFSKTLFLKKSKKVTKMTSFLGASVNDYIEFLNDSYRVINIVYKNVYSSAYREYHSDFEDDGIELGRKQKIPKLIPYKSKSFSFMKRRLFFVYDIETVPDLEHKQHYMYCLCATAFTYCPSLFEYTDKIDLSVSFFNERQIVINLMDDINSLNEDMLISIQHKVAEKFANFIISEANIEYKNLLGPDNIPDQELEIRIIGFNNRNFDDHHIVQDLLRSIKYYKRLVHKRDMKIVSHEISSYHIIPNETITLYFDDVVVWLPEILSLKLACKELDISLSKLDFNVVRFNELCLFEGKMIKSCDLDMFISLWHGDLAIIKSAIDKVKKFKKFTMLNNAFYDLFKKRIEFTNFTQQIELKEFITSYCTYDVYATAELFIKLNESFSSCIREIYKENNLLDSVLYYNLSLEHYIISDQDSDSLKRKTASFKVPNFEFLSLSSYLTPSQASYTIFKIMYKDNLRINNNYNLGLSSVIDDAFFGGLVLLGGIGCFNGYIRQVDVRSEYPLAASGCLPLLNDIYDYKQKLSSEHINSLNLKIKKAILLRNDFFNAKILHYQSSISAIYELIDFMGIYRCKVVPPVLSEHTTMISPLILAIKGPSGARKIDTFNIPYIKFFTSAHIKNFILYGWQIEILKCDDNIQYHYNIQTEKFESCYQKQFCYLRKFISFFNEKKANSSNKVMKKFFKALMNLLCGRLAMKSDSLITTLNESNDADGYSSSIKRTKLFDNNKNDKWLAVFINTSAHNIILSKIFLLELKQMYDHVPLEKREPVLIYCDTDSMYFDTKHVFADLDFKLADELGDFNLSTFDYDVTWTSKLSGLDMISIYVLFKKGYIVLDKDDYIKDFKTKGVPQKDLKSIFYSCDGKLKKESLDLLFSSAIAIPINSLVNKQDRDSLKKTFFNIQIIKNLKIDQLSNSLLDFSWKPAIVVNPKLKLTHSPCSVCEVCKSWFGTIQEHKRYVF